MKDKTEEVRRRVQPDLRWRWRQQLRDNRVLSADARLAGHTLSTRMRPEGWCFYKIADLSADMGIKTDRTRLRRARAAIRELKNHGYLVRRLHYGKLTRYQAKLPGGEETCPTDGFDQGTTHGFGQRSPDGNGQPNRTSLRTGNRTNTRDQVATTSQEGPSTTTERPGTTEEDEGVVVDWDQPVEMEEDDFDYAAPLTPEEERRFFG